MKDSDYPIELDADYPCRGKAATGEHVAFPDLLAEGDLVGNGGPPSDPYNTYGPYRRVVKDGDRLLIPAEPTFATIEEATNGES